MRLPKLSWPQLAHRAWRDIGLILPLFIGSALILGFGMLVEEVLEGDTSRFDHDLMMALRSGGNPADPIGPPWAEEAARDLTALGSYAFLSLLFLSLIGYLILIRKRAFALLVSVAVLGGPLISTALKTLFDRPRPDFPHAARVFTASFPSGHAMLSAITFLTLGALLTRTSEDHRLKIYFMTLALFFTLLVGASRVYLGVHYPTDVLAGWCVGAAWAALCWSGALWLQRRGKVERADPEALMRGR